MSEILAIRGLRKKFGGVVAADGIDLVLRAGQVLGLIGPNGAGKTSLFNLVTGAIPPDSGLICLNGRDIGGLSMTDRARAGLIRTWQHIRLFPSLTVLDNLLVSARLYPDETPLGQFRPGVRARRRELRERAMAQLDRVRLSDSALRRPTELSYGRQKLAGLARALMNDGDCLLLDEPMGGVEGPAFATIQELVLEEAARGRAICVIEHNISFIRDLCDSAGFMFNGRIMAMGSIEDMIRDPALNELYFGTAG